MRKFLVFFISIFFCTKIFSKEINFPVSGLMIGSERTVDLKAEWDDSWFNASPFVYNHNLARIGAIFSELAYVNVDKFPENNQLKKSYNLIGIKNSEIEFHYDINYSNSAYGTNQAAFSIGSKKIIGSGGKNKTLVFVSIRGTPPKADEWISDLEVLSEFENNSVHSGFSKCVEQVYSSLIYYLLKQKISPDETVFFITGHSRGAAIANLLGIKLSDGEMFSSENIFVYTYACPNYIQAEEKLSEEKYDFIWNIINSEDIVPSLPPYRKKWFFQKFGNILTFSNQWSTDKNIYEEKYLPKINSYYNLFAGRDYCPFNNGPFIQTQFSRVLTDSYKTIKKYYASWWKFPERTQKMVEKFFANSPDDSSVSFDTNVWYIKLLDMVTNGGSERIINSIEDMHASEFYLSCMLALNEEECFSDLGSVQIVFDGFYECAVFDESGEMVAQILDGAIQYGKIKSPIAVMPLLGKKVAVGFPANQNFSVLIYKESLIPTVVSAQIERYDSAGVLISVEKKEYLHPHIGMGLEFNSGEILMTENIAPQKIIKEELSFKVANGELKQQEKFFIYPEFSIDINKQMGIGIHVGNRNIYGSFFTSQPLNNFGSVLELSPGVGHQNALVANMILDSEFYTRFIYVFDDRTDCGWNFVPSAKFTFSFKPRNRLSLFAAFVFDFHFAGFNDSVFSEVIREQKMNGINFNDKFSLVPTISFGARF